MKKIILYLLFIITTFGLANAVDLNNSEFYYSFDDDDLTGSNPIDIATNVHNGTNNGATTGITGILNEAFSFDGLNDYVDSNFQATSSNSDTFSFSVWVNSTGTNSGFVAATYAGGTELFGLEMQNSGTQMRHESRDSTNNVISSAAFNINKNTWTHVVLVRDNPNNVIRVYVDGVNVQNTTDTRAGHFGTGVDWYVGQRNDLLGVKYFTGELDEFNYYSEALNSSQVLELYNSGAGYNPYAVAATPTITINNPVNNAYYNTSSQLLNVSTDLNTNLSYSFNGGSEISLCNNCNSSQNVTLTLVEGLNNLTVYSNYTGTISNKNISFTLDTTSPTINNNILSEYNSYVVDFNSSCTDTNLLSCYIEINSQNVSLNVSQFNFTTNGNQSYNITAIDFAGNRATATGITLINPYQSFSFEDSLNVSITNFTFGGRSDNGTGTVQYLTYGDGLILGNNSLDFSKLGYITQSFTFNINDTSDINVTYTVSEAEIVVTIYDRESGTIVSGPTFQLEFIASVGLVTNTSTGTKTITNTFFQAEDYELRVTNESYTSESVFFTFDNQESLPISVHVTDLNDTQYGIVDVKVVDKFGKSITAALVEALQWNSNTSSYETVSQGRTAEDGKTLLNIILDTKQYIFKATSGELTKNTTPQYIPTLLNGKEIVISLDLGPTEFEGFLENIHYNITENYTNNVSNISLSWVNTDGLDTEGCIKYYRVYPSGQRIELSEDCSTASSGILLTSKLINTSFRTQAQVGFTIDGLFYVQKKYDYAPSFDISQILAETNIALYILPLLYLAVVLIGMANVFIGAVSLIVVSGLGLWLVPQFLSPAIVVFFYFIGLIIMVGGTKRK